MIPNKKPTSMDIREKISVLWIVVLINMAFADICGFVLPGAMDTPIEITQEIMLGCAIVLEISIAMIFLSRVLKHRANRWANTIASTITILFVIGGGSPFLHYYFFATIEIVCMLAIIWISWKWKNPEDSPN